MKLFASLPDWLSSIVASLGIMLAIYLIIRVLFMSY